jgi:hypothetical protein
MTTGLLISNNLSPPLQEMAKQQEPMGTRLEFAYDFVVLFLRYSSDGTVPE